MTPTWIENGRVKRHGVYVCRKRLIFEATRYAEKLSAANFLHTERLCKEKEESGVKKRQVWAPVLCAALLMTALPGTDQKARADGQDGPIEEILLVKTQEEDAGLREVFRIHSDEGEKSEKINEDELKELGESSDTAVLILGREKKEQADSEEGGTTEETETEEAQKESEAEEAETEDVPISKSQQQRIEQVAETFDKVVVLFNNYRPYGLEILNEYASIQSITMIQAADEEQLQNAAEALVEVVSAQETAAKQPESEETEAKQEEETAEETAKEMEQTESNAETESEPVAEAETEQEQNAAAAEEKVQEEFQASRQESERPIGDVNGDGRVDSQDASALMGLVGQEAEDGLTYGDVTGDGRINKRDVKELLKYITGEITGFETEEK